MEGFRFLPTVLVSLCLRVVYKVITWVAPVNAKQVTFASYRSSVLKDNLAAVYKEWERTGDPIEPVFLLKPLSAGLIGKMRYVLHMLRACWYLATSRYFIIDDYYFPVYVITPRKGTEIIQLWHAAGAFKKFGYSTVNKEFGPSEAYLKRVRIHSNYSRVMVSCQEIIPFYAEAFKMDPANILPLGVPRTDFFFDQEGVQEIKDSFYKTYPELETKFLILYAPTFRGASHDQDMFECPLDILKMKAALGDDYALLVHLHPYMRKGMRLSNETKGFVYMMEGSYPIEALLSLTDLLITDYSSILFDYSLREKPMAFFAQDLEEYEKERGFYYDYKSIIPGPLFHTTLDLVNWIQEGSYDINRVSAFKHRFFDETDGCASARIVDYLVKNRR